MVDFRVATGSFQRAPDGLWSASLPAGTYTITPQAVQGLIGTAHPFVVRVAVGSVPTSMEVDYDTGIR